VGFGRHREKHPGSLRRKDVKGKAWPNCAERLERGPFDIQGEKIGEKRNPLFILSRGMHRSRSSPSPRKKGEAILMRFFARKRVCKASIRIVEEREPSG